MTKFMATSPAERRSGNGQPGSGGYAAPKAYAATARQLNGLETSAIGVAVTIAAILAVKVSMLWALQAM